MHAARALQLPQFAYEAVQILQDVAGTGGSSSSGIDTLVEGVADVLQSAGVSFNSLISNNTGIFVNLTQVRMCAGCVRGGV